MGSLVDSCESLAEAVLAGKRDALAQAITWVESTLPEHQARNEELLRRTYHSDRSTQRLGITGIPGAKSTLIERLGMDAIDRGHRVAVLAVDPSSTRTKGSLLGDKTRMQSLSMHPDARSSGPPPLQGRWVGHPGHFEAIQLCEAAGFNLILVETVGVGQSEVTVRDMVDIFVLTLIGGAGDDVQGIKRGVVEMCDILLVHKCDGDRVKSSQLTAAAYSQALHLLPMPSSNPCSSGSGVQPDGRRHRHPVGQNSRTPGYVEDQWMVDPDNAPQRPAMPARETTLG